MRFRCLVIALALLVAFASDSWGQSQKSFPNKQATQPPATDQRGTDQVPLTVKILPAPDSEKKAQKEETDGREKIETDRKLASETERIANYTKWLALFTGFLFAIAVLQAGFFLWQLRLMGEEAKRARAAFISTNRPKIVVHFADLKRFPDPNAPEGASELEHLGVILLCFNKGRGAAEDVEVRGEIRVTEKIPDAKILRKMIEPAIESVESGIKIWTELNSNRPIQELLAFKAQAKAYFVGVIVYFDQNKRRRETGFCFVFETQSMRWVSAESKEHEYAY